MDDEEEEDIVLPGTDLGRYLNTHHLFDHHDVLSSFPVENEQTESTTSHYGFICGQNIPDIYEYLFSAIACRILPATKQFTHIIRSIRYWFSELKDAVMTRAIILTWLLKVLPSCQSSPQLLSKADVIAYKFSLEYRMLKESALMQECSTKISSSLQELHQLVTQLQSVKQDCPNFDNKCNVIIEEIERIRHSVDLLLVQMRKLLSSQANSIGRFRRRVSGLQAKKQLETCLLDTAEEDAEVPVDQVESCEISSQDRFMFENEVPETILEDTMFTSRDEVFELKASDDPEEVPDLNSSSPNDSFTKEILEIQTELMTQLRGTLSTRRADMKAREAKAYLDSYGQLPEEPEDNPFEVSPSPFSSSQSESPVPRKRIQNFRLEFSESPLTAEVVSPVTFGDEIDECADLGMKTEFLSSLQELLGKRGGCFN